MRLLLVEDHAELARMTAEHLGEAGFCVDVAYDLDAASRALGDWSFDALIIDLGLPDGDGATLLAAARKLGVPAIIATARQDCRDRIAGLDGGADDYLVKPFDLDELAARVRAVLRRPGERRSSRLQLGGLTLDLATREASVGGVDLGLSRRELAVLECLLRAAGRLVVRDVIEEQVYSWNEAVTPNAMETAISRLRKRLAAAEADVRIETRRGIGYRLHAVA